ncbi:Equilibrative nucleoside transporter [Dillenia turbinata]|uniref:Equilibrative nucleoside transporter n=1 Tax=Dillenia turbinata TaxID=194707 RepID=A0AAN8UX21_9MAGN
MQHSCSSSSSSLSRFCFPIHVFDDQGKFIAMVTCFILGLGQLIPWNSVTTITDYYYQVFPKYHPSRVLTLMYQPFALGTIATLAYYEAKIDTRKRNLFGYVLYTVCTLMLIMIDLAASGKGGIGPYIGICAMVACFGVGDGFVQGGMVGDLSFMDPDFLQSYTAGMAASGALTSGLRLVAKAAFENSSDGLRKGTMMFLAIATFFAFICLLLYALFFPRLPIIKYYRSKAASEGSKTVCADLAAAGIQTDTSPRAEDKEKQEERLSNKQLLLQNIDYALDLYLTYVLTLSIFPGFLYENTGTHQLGSWYPLVLIAMFNVGDFLSRYIPLIPCLKLESRKGLILATLSRLLLIPAFYFTAKYGAQGWMIMLVSVLGLSNGYLTICVLTIAPKGYKAPEQNALGNLLSLFLIFGISTGAGLTGSMTTSDQNGAPTRLEGKFRAMVACWILGFGSLIAWNSMLTIGDYYYQLFPTYHPSRVLTLVYQPFAIGTMAILAYNEAKIDTRKRNLLGYAFFTVSTFMLIVLDLATSGKGGIGPYVGICAIVACFGIADAYVQGGMVGDLSFMNPDFIQSFFAGLAASGALTSGLRLSTKAAFEKSSNGLRKGTMLFLAISTFFEFICILIYAFFFPRLPIIKYYRAKAASEGSKTVSADLAAAGIQTHATQQAEDKEKHEERLTNKQLILQNIDYALDLYLIYVLTLSIFPGFLYENTGTHQLGSWYPLVLIAMYNVWDFIARYTPLIPCLKLESRKGLMIAILSRFLLIPAFYFTAKYGDQGWMIMLISVLGLSNGHLTVCVLTVAPKGYKAPEQNALGNLLVLFLLGGIFTGVALGWLWIIGNGTF